MLSEDTFLQPEKISWHDFSKKREESSGLAPGSLVFIGTRKMESTRIRVIDYTSHRLDEIELKDIVEAKRFKNRDPLPGSTSTGFTILN